MKLCCIIPVYNSQGSIEEVVEGAKGLIDDIIVIDDGSTDNTALLAKKAGAHVIKVSGNRGKGNVLRLAFRYAKASGYDAIITLDADLQHDPSEIPAFIEKYTSEKSHIVSGNRLHDREKIPRIRYVPNWIGTRLFSRLIGQAVYDSQCGFRLYDRRIIDNIPIVRDGFDAESDILLRAGKRGYRIDFVPIKTIYPEGRGSGSFYRPVRDTFHICTVYLKNLFWKNR